MTGTGTTLYRGVLLACAMGGLLLPEGASGAASAPNCIAVHASVDTVGADTVLAFAEGRGVGEVVTARDTLVTAVTFWIPHQYDNDFVQGFLYVTQVDSAGSPATTQVVYASQLVTPPLATACICDRLLSWPAHQLRSPNRVRISLS